MDRHIRVLVANRPKLMREIVIEACSGQPDIEIIGEVAEDRDIPSRVEETRPDFLFVSLEDPDKRPRVCDTILRLHPQVRVIAVGERSNRSVKYWASFRIHHQVIEASEESLLSVIREDFKEALGAA